MKNNNVIDLFIKIIKMKKNNNINLPIIIIKINNNINLPNIVIKI